jgi:hypothetical protein
MYHLDHGLIAPLNDINIPVHIDLSCTLHHLIMHVLLLILDGQLCFLDDNSVHLLEVLNLIRLSVQQV